MKRSLNSTAVRRKTPARDILSNLPEVFGVREIEKYVNHPTQWLARAAFSGQVVRLQRGIYWNRSRYSDLPLPYLACQIKSAPSYVSCEWALHAGGVLLQRPFTCTVVTLSTAVGRKREIRLMGETIEFSHMTERLFWGYEQVEGYFLASVEKAYLDTLYFGRDPERWGELETGIFDFEALQTMAEKFPPRISKRIASMVPSIVRRAEEYMRAHLDEPLSIVDLLRICSCNRGTLFSAFRSARSYTPMEFLTEQRLQKAWEKMKRPTPEDSVASIALECGFTSFGRFAQIYRKRFGERPSEALRRGREKD